MLITEITDIKKYYRDFQDAKYRGNRIATHYVGRSNSQQIPDEIKKLADKHIKPRSVINKHTHHSHYINQYNDEWYQRNFGVSGFDSFWRKFAPYYSSPTL